MNKKLQIKIRYNTVHPQQKKGFSQREKKALTRILLAVVFSGLFFIFFAPGCSLHSYYTLKKKSNMLFEENKSLLRETVELGREIKFLQNDKGYLEKVAREKYGMLKKDEEVYYLSPEARKKRKRRTECVPLP